MSTNFLRLFGPQAGCILSETPGIYDVGLKVRKERSFALLEGGKGERGGFIGEGVEADSFFWLATLSLLSYQIG